MTLWRLEWLRLVRTKRLVALVGVYLFFGLLGPVTARYLPQILARFGGDIVVQIPDPVPADGIAQFTSNANQIGLLVVVIVAAGALVVDALPEMSIFLRTRVPSPGRIVPPRLVMSFAAAGAAFVLGMAAAWYETVVLLGALPVGTMLLGTLFGLLYLAFVVALVAAVAGRTGSVLAASAAAVVILLLLPVLGLIDPVGRRLPSHLLGAAVAMVAGSSDAGDYVQAAGVTVIVTALLSWAAVRWAGRREL